MYSRRTTTPPKKIVQNGKINFGAFFPVPSRIDIRGVIAPFAGLPLPSPITNFRIRGRIAYMFSVGNFIGFLEIFDGKIFGLADIILWNRDTKRKYFYHTFMTVRRRFISVSTDKGIFSSRVKSRNIKLSWNREKNRIALTFNLHGNSVYPSITGYLHSEFKSPLFDEFASITPAPVTSRCSASWIINTNSSGSITIKGKKAHPDITVSESQSISCFVLNRMFYKFHTNAKITCGIGMNDGKQMIFRFVNSTNDAIDADAHNENFFSIDGKRTLMPGTVITHHYGIDKKWVIQDTENMVDLTFTPISVSKRSLHVIVFRTMYNSVYGTFDGVLINDDGEKIVFKDFPGIATSNMIRL